MLTDSRARAERASDAYAIIRAQLRDFIDLERAQMTPELAAARYMELAKQRREVQAQAPAVEEWARNKVIEDGGTERSKRAGLKPSGSALG